MTKRSGAPPLRFKGSEIARHACSNVATDIAITLWRRRTGGYVAAVEIEEFASSASQTSLQDAMTWLEKICASDEPFRVHSAGRHAPFDHAMAAANHRAVRILAGDALNQWDLLAESEVA